MRRRTLAVAPFTAAVAALAVLACASPTLPLPPPEPPTMLQGQDLDHINLVAGCGAAEPSALIIVVNTNTSVPSGEQVRGTFADATCGSWQVPNVFAHNGDVLNIQQEFGSETSTVLTIQVRVP
jgi:hypothetical protein